MSVSLSSIEAMGQQILPRVDLGSMTSQTLLLFFCPPVLLSLVNLALVCVYTYMCVHWCVCMYVCTLVCVHACVHTGAWVCIHVNCVEVRGWCLVSSFALHLAF